MAKKYLQECLQSLVIREMQTKTTMRFHLIPIKMTKIKNSGHRMASMWEKRNTPPLLVGFQTAMTTLEINLEVPKIINLAIPLLGIYPEDAPSCYRAHVLLHP